MNATERAVQLRLLADRHNLLRFIQASVPMPVVTRPGAADAEDALLVAWYHVPAKAYFWTTGRDLADGNRTLNADRVEDLAYGRAGEMVAVAKAHAGGEVTAEVDALIDGIVAAENTKAWA